MQVEVSLKVSAEEFYQLLISSLQEEVEMVTHKKYTEDQLSGLRYKKKSHAQGQTVKIHVGKLISNKHYENFFAIHEISTHVTYDLEPTGPLSCKVLYTEQYSKKPKASLLNPPQRRAKKMIRACEKYIIDHRG